jgi:hypothetical protein
LSIAGRATAKKLSPEPHIIESMFEDRQDAAAVVHRMCAAARAENRAAGERLAAIGELDVLRLRECGERETWSTDTWDAISAEVAAALGISAALASSLLDYARAMRIRLPQVGAALLAGDISYAMFQTIVYRTTLITDPEVMAAVDAELALKVRRWPSLTRARLAAYVDMVVERADSDAVRRRREAQANREFSIWDGGQGLTEVFGRLHTTDAHAVDARLDALAATVCDDDPRTRKQRRADAMGALAAGADRLDCQCRKPHCPADQSPLPRPVVIHVIAEQASVQGAGNTPGVLVGAQELIPAELVAELAKAAKLVPLNPFRDVAPEQGYTPSANLAEFVRCRDLTCRAPGCDRPATQCDLDHTVPFARRGATHASNIKCLCRFHHLLKTFWGWNDKQLADGTVIWTLPSGQTYVTTPGSALLFPSLCAPTGDLSIPSRALAERCTVRAMMMPQRRRTRAQNRANYVAEERRQNRRTRLAAQAAQARPPNPDEPPPF